MNDKILIKNAIDWINSTKGSGFGKDISKVYFSQKELIQIGKNIENK
jgi:hypothetical protein